MPNRRINQRIIERLEGLSPQKRREALALLEDLATPPAASRAKKKAGRNARGRLRRRKSPGQVFWDRLVAEGLYDGDGRQ